MSAAPAVDRAIDLPPSGVPHQGVPDTRWIPIAALFETKWNPRTQFAKAPLDELARSIAAKGQQIPATVRPAAKGRWEIVFGARRFRATKLAGGESLLCIVREMDDATVRELIATEAKHAEGLDELDEALSYQNMIKEDRLSVRDVAEKIGLSEEYVYGRVKLLSLIPEAKKLFRGEDAEAGRPPFTAAHAIIIAREPASVQAKIIDPKTGALYEPTHEDVDELMRELPLNDRRRARYRLCTTRELAQWVADHVRFDEAAVAATDLFPQTRQLLEEAKAEDVDVVSIKFDSYIQPEARGKDRTYPVSAWKKVSDDRLCEYWKIGVVRAGVNRGQSFKVCVNRERCKIHWREQAARAEKNKERKKQGKPAAPRPGQTTADIRWQKQEKARQEKQKREAAERQAKIEQFNKAVPALRDALVAKIKSMPAKASGILADILVKEMRVGKPYAGIARGSSAEDLIRFLAFQELASDLDGHWAWENFPAAAKAIGLNIAPIVASFAPKAEAKKTPAKKKVKKK